MAYRRLPFHEYFINTSEDYNNTGWVTYRVHYTAVKYCTGKLEKALGLSHEVNYEMHYEPERDAIQINFQRTFGFADWFTNVFEFSSKYYDAITFRSSPLQLRVHHGWGNMYKAIKWRIRDEWSELKEQHPTAETEILGWSLGSAIAALCCQDLNYNFGLKSYIYAYGCVRPFKSKRKESGLLRSYLDTLCKGCFCFSDVNDIISYMPPFRGFMTVGRVDLGHDLKRTFFRMVNPWRYHTHYDRPELYAPVYKKETSE